MTKYYYTNINLSDSQNEKIKNAIESDTNVSIKLSYEDLNGKHKLALTESQINRMGAAYSKNKGITLLLSRAQLKYNVKKSGKKGNKSAGNANKSGGNDNKIAGNDNKIDGNANKIDGKGIIYGKKDGYGFKIRKVGKGVFLSPWNSGYNYSDGYYLKNGNDYTSIGKELLLGDNSPIKRGGFLPLLALLGTALASAAPIIAKTAATAAIAGAAGAAGNAIVNKIAGKGIIYGKKNGYGIKIIKAGKGVFLNPWNSGYNYLDGYYLKNGNDYSSVGKGLLLGNNSPFKKIPFLGSLL